jgi:hypothetical protein
MLARALQAAGCARVSRVAGSELAPRVEFSHGRSAGARIPEFPTRAPVALVAVQLRSEHCARDPAPVIADVLR